MDNSTISENFVKRFSTLDGNSTANRRQSFGKLLHDFKFLKNNDSVLSKIVEDLKPTTYLEELFKLDFLIYFRRTEDLIKALFEGKNDVFVKKISKQWWLFEEYFENVDIEHLLNMILPSLSYSVRMKILKKLSQVMPSEKFQSVFDGVLSRYGTFVAMKFISGCTTEFIKETITLDNIELTQIQLQKLYYKDPSLINFYLSNTKHTMEYEERAKLLKFLFNQDQDFYQTVLTTQSFYNIELGKRTTRKLVKNKRNDMIENPHKYTHLKMKVAFRKLGKDSFELYRKMLPSNIDNLKLHVYDESWVFQFAQNFPDKLKYHLYFKVMEDHFKARFIDHIDQLNSEIIGLIKNNAERAQYAKLKIEKGSKKYIKYLQTKDSIPMIKDAINFTPNVRNRCKFVHLLVETCAINNDLDALLDVIKHFNQRHKNDDVTIYSQFIRSIEYHFGFKNFTEEIWQALNNLFLVYMLKSDTKKSNYQKIQTLPLMSYNVGISRHQKLSYLEFLFKQGKLIDNLLEDYIAFKFYESFFKWGTYEKTFEKYFIMFAIDRLSNKAAWDENLEKNIEVINNLNDWNCHYKDDKLSLYDFPSLYYTLVTSVKKDDKLNVVIKKAFKEKIFTSGSNQHRQAFLDIYWDRCHVLVSTRDLLWFLKFDFQTVSNYFEKFLKTVLTFDLKSQVRIWYFIKKLDFLDIYNDSIKFCFSKMDEIGSIVGLSVLLRPLDFVAFVESYKPSNTRYNPTNLDEVRLLNIRQTISKCFKNRNSYEMLPYLLHYCTGFYFKNSVKSLYSLMHKTPETLLSQYLAHLSQSSNLIKKHCIFLLCALSTVSEAEAALYNKKAHLSKQKHFKTAFFYFLKNPNNTSFNMIKTSIMLLKTFNQKIMSCIPKIPQKYKTLYIEYTWNYIEQAVKNPNTLLKLQENLLKSITGEEHEISLNFALDVIRQLFQTQYSKDWYIFKFSYHFVAHHADTEKFYSELFSILDQNSYKNKQQFFRNYWFYTAMGEYKNIDYLKPFFAYFDKQFTPEKNFKNYTELQFLKIKAKLFSVSELPDKIDLMAVSIAEVFDNLINKFGPFIVPLFASRMESLLMDYFLMGKTYTKWSCYYKLILSKKPEVAMLLLRVMDYSYKDPDEDFKVFLNILKEILTIDDVTVQLHLQECYGYYIKNNLKQ